MTEKTILLPKSDNAPAKVKDRGVINLVKAGAAAYNAKSGELLLLPVGERRRRDLSSRLCDALHAEAAVQYVNCGSDHAIFTLAERYLKDWGITARAFSDERGRAINLIGWCADSEEARAKLTDVKSAAIKALDGVADFFFVDEVLDSGSLSSSLVTLSDSDALTAREAFLCPTCRKVFFPNTPVEFRVDQPGAGEAEEPLTDVETPGANTIADLCVNLGIDIKRTLKAMLYIAYDELCGIKPVAAFVRGDFHVSKAKLSAWLKDTYGLTSLRSAEKSELTNLIGEVAGYCGPIGLPDSVIIVCDESVRGSKNTVAGANRTGYHRTGCCHGRDFDAPIADIAQVSAGIPCPCGASELESVFLRDCGSIVCDKHLLKKTGAIDEKTYKVLSSRGRDGVAEYPIEWSGDISVECVILAESSE